MFLLEFMAQTRLWELRAFKCILRNVESEVSRAYKGMKKLAVFTCPVSSCHILYDFCNERGFLTPAITTPFIEC